MTVNYPLRPFRITEKNMLCAVIRQYPLATLFSGSAGQAQITLIPLMVEQRASGEIVLSGHLDRNNAQAEAIVPGAPISFQFLGPDAYASPDLYPDPQLPGWLYVSVQGDGEVSAIVEGEELRSLLVESTRTFGAPDQRFGLDARDERVAKFLPGIKGFHIRATRISGIAKLAQDKGEEDSLIAMKFLSAQSNGSSEALFARLLRETL